MTEQAWAVANAAMRRASVQVRPLRTLDEMATACRLLDDVWEIPQGQVSEVRPSLLRALDHSGNYLVGAQAVDGPHAGQMVAASVAFFGEPIGLSLHSHITGVLPGTGHGVGAAIKWHQRAWSLDRGLRRVTWTYDPLIARNCYFNVGKLGARPRRYFVDFYGPMDDGPNRGQPTDRTDANWELRSDSTLRAAGGVLDPVERSAAADGPDADALRAAGAVVALSVGPGGEPLVGETAGGDPVVGDAASGEPAVGTTLLVGIPLDIEAIRRSDDALALRWRLALRGVLAPLLAGERWQVTGFARSGWYVLEPGGMA